MEKLLKLIPALAFMLAASSVVFGFYVRSAQDGMLSREKADATYASKEVMAERFNGIEGRLSRIEANGAETNKLIQELLMRQGRTP